MAGTYTAKVTLRDGTGASAVPNVNIEPLRWTLSEMGVTAVRAPVDSPLHDELALLQKELAIYRDTDLLWRGPLIKDSTSTSSSEKRYVVPDKSWYLNTRQISDARENRLDNGDFAGGTTDWTNIGSSTHSASTAHSARGGHSLKLVQATAGVDTFDYQQQTFTAGSIGSLITLRAWVYIDDSAWVGPAFESRGLFVSGIQGGVVRDVQVAEIDDATPRNRLVPLTVRIWIPPGETWTLEARLYAPGGEVYWSAARLVKMESLSFYATDLGEIVGSAVEFVQDIAHGWDDLGITVDNATTGIVLDWHFQYADHTDLVEILNAAEAMGLDWSIEITATTAVFTTYFPKGTDRTSGPGAVTFSMHDPVGNPTGNVAHAEIEGDGEKARTRSTVLGEGSGPEREEGYATDTSDTGGLVLGEVFSAPAGTPIDALDLIAANRVAAKKKPPRILKVVGLPGNTTQLLTCVVGDTVAVDIVQGGEVIDGNWRIVAKTITPEFDRPDFVLNEVA